MTVPAFSPANEQWLRDFCADLRAIDNEPDLVRLAAWAKRWVRVRTAVIAGLAFATVVLAGMRVVGGYSLAPLPVGSVVVLAMLLHAAGESLCAGLLSAGSTLVSRRLHYRMYWQRPIDSAWIGELLHGATRNEFYRGCFVTGLIAATAILLPTDSDLLVPTAAVVVSACYVSVIVDVVPQRLSIQSIVRRAKTSEIGAIQERIERFGPQLPGLGAEDFAELERLVRLSDMIRASPSRLRIADSAARIAVAVIIPTLGFVASVVGEHFAGRLFEGIPW